MTLKEGPAPAPGQDDYTRPPQDLGNSNARATNINVSPTVPAILDVRIRDRFVRYASDPRPGRTAGAWRTGRDGVPERVSPLALQGITVGRRGWIEIRAIHPGTGDRYLFEGSVDEIADELHRTGSRLGCRAARKNVYWAIYESVQAVRRQAAARGGAE